MRRAISSLLLPALATFVALAVLISLGNWQMQRLAWKESLIQDVTERPKQRPLTQADALLEAAHDELFFAQFEYRQALLEGQFDPSREVLAFTSLSDARGPFGGPGFWVLTPFVTQPDSAVVYVNRGFVPEAARGSYAPPPAGHVEVLGLLRAPEKGSWLTPEPDLAERVFFARDPQRIAAATGEHGNVAGFFVDLGPSGTPQSGLPQAGETRTIFANSHLEYALTWYGLAAGLAAVFAVFAYGRVRGGSGGGNRAEREGRLTDGGEAP